jgi:hypothetical protein
MAPQARLEVISTRSRRSGGPLSILTQSMTFPSLLFSAAFFAGACPFRKTGLH